MSQYVTDKIESFANELLPSMDLELVEVQFRREGHGWVLRLFIDGENGITHDNCSQVSREISDYLDVEDLVEHKYQLEISSPGLERPLKSIGDFQRFSGRKAKVKLRDIVEEQKIYIGKIKKIDGNRIELILDDGKTIEFSYENIRKARLTL